MKKYEYEKPYYEVITLLPNDIILTSQGDIDPDWDDEEEPDGLTSFSRGFSEFLENIGEGFSETPNVDEQLPTQDNVPPEEGFNNTPSNNESFNTMPEIEPSYDMPPMEESFNESPIEQNIDVDGGFNNIDIQ